MINAGIGIQGVNAQSTHQLTGPFGDVDVTIPQISTSASNWGSGSQFYTLNTSGPKFSINPVLYTVANNLTGTFYTITVSATGDNINSITLYNDIDVELSMTTTSPLVYTTPVGGDYRAVVVTESGCQFTENITLD